MKPDRSVSVVDDEESIREAIDALLRSVGFQVAAFASAEEFLGAEALGRTACLILDLRIPGMDGLQLQQRSASTATSSPSSSSPRTRAPTTALKPCAPGRWHSSRSRRSTATSCSPQSKRPGVGWPLVADRGRE
jgi:hypothetical protein